MSQNFFIFFDFCITYGLRQPSSYECCMGGRTADAEGPPGPWAPATGRAGTSGPPRPDILLFWLLETTNCCNHTSRIGIPCFPSCHSWFRAKQSQKAIAGESIVRNKPNLQSVEMDVNCRPARGLGEEYTPTAPEKTKPISRRAGRSRAGIHGANCAKRTQFSGLPPRTCL
jgi:hypothetical protein